MDRYIVHRLRPYRLCPRTWWIFGTAESTDFSGSVMLYTLSRDLSLFSQLLDNGYQVLGHEGNLIPFITSHPQGEWIEHKYKWNWTKASEKFDFHNIHLIQHSISKTTYKIQTVTNNIIETIHNNIYIIIYYSKYISLKYVNW